MNMHQEIRRGAMIVVVATFLAGVSLPAHPMTYHGTVLAAEPAKVQVKVIDEKTKKEDAVWFVVDKNTKVKRGETRVAYANAHIAKGERIVIIVNMDAKIKMLAEEIRLAPQ